MTKWIRKQLESGKLKGKPILYYKELGEPSHATALDYLINKYDWNKDNEEVIEEFLPESQSISQLKKELGYKREMSDLALNLLRKRIGIYNPKHGTSHSAPAVQIGESTTWLVDFIPSYVPTKAKAIEVTQLDLFHNNEAKAFINQHPEEFIDKEDLPEIYMREGNQYFRDGELFPTLEDAQKEDFMPNSEEINYSFKAVNILSSDRAKQIFDKGNKNNWTLDKILNELAIPKEQKQLLLGSGIVDREQLILELATKYNYGIEIKTAKKQLKPINNPGEFSDDEIDNLFAEDFSDKSGNTTYYSNPLHYLMYLLINNSKKL